MLPVGSPGSAYFTISFSVIVYWKKVAVLVVFAAVDVCDIVKNDRRVTNGTLYRKNTEEESGEGVYVVQKTTRRNG